MSAIDVVFKELHPEVIVRNTANNDIVDPSTPIPIEDGDNGITIETTSIVAFYDTPAFEVHVIASGLPSIRLFDVRLDVPSGCGSRRTDTIKFTNGAVRIAHTFNKGFYVDYQALNNQKAQEKRRGALFRWKDKVYAGVIGSRSGAEIPDIGGFDVSMQRMLVCNREQFGNVTPIESQDELVFGDKRFIVGQIEERPASVTFYLQQSED